MGNVKWWGSRCLCSFEVCTSSITVKHSDPTGMISAQYSTVICRVSLVCGSLLCGSSHFMNAAHALLAACFVVVVQGKQIRNTLREICCGCDVVIHHGMSVPTRVTIRRQN
jgi:hypothetical protein